MGLFRLFVDFKVPPVEAELQKALSRLSRFASGDQIRSGNFLYLLVCSIVDSCMMKFVLHTEARRCSDVDRVRFGSLFHDSLALWDSVPTGLDDLDARSRPRQDFYFVRVKITYVVGT